MNGCTPAFTSAETSICPAANYHSQAGVMRASESVGPADGLRRFQVGWTASKRRNPSSASSHLYPAYETMRLVYRLANNGDVAGGQLAVFQGASEAPISESYGSIDPRPVAD
jgi:hypothetical protein